MRWVHEQGYVPVGPLRPALALYGGLAVEIRGFGVNTWRESFDLDPVKTGLERDRIDDWAEDLGMPLAPVGLGDRGNSLLTIGTDGRVFAIAMNISIVGADITDAIENMVLGRRGAQIDIDQHRDSDEGSIGR